MFWIGSVVSETPKRSAVAGISCMRPLAPLWLTASMRPADSMLMTARTRAGDTRVPTVARSISAPCCSAIRCRCASRGAGTALPDGPRPKAISAASNRPPASPSRGEIMSQYQSSGPVAAGAGAAWAVAASRVLGRSPGRAPGGATQPATASARACSSGSICTVIRRDTPAEGGVTRRGPGDDNSAGAAVAGAASSSGSSA